MTSLLCGVTAGIFFTFGKYSTSLIGACFYQTACILDNCDGEIARTKNLGSAFGSWFDIATDFLTDLCLFGGIGLSLLLQSMDKGVLSVTILCLFGTSMHVILVIMEKLRGFGPAQHGNPNPGRRNGLSIFFDAIREGDVSWVVVLLALAGMAHALIWIGAFYMQILWITALTVNYAHLTKPR